MWILGINNMHDASAALVCDGKVVAAAEEERFVRKKHISGFPKEAIRSCLDQAGISLKDVDAVGVSWRYWVLRHRILCAVKSAAGSMSNFRAKASRGTGQMKHEWAELFWMRNLLESNFGKGGFKLFHLDHHLCHQVSTFFPSPFERAAILTMDGAGEEASTVLSLGEGTKIHELKRISLPHSLGQFYAAMTGFLGFKMQADEYKMMGLASYGEPRFAPFFRKEVLTSLPDGDYRLNHRLLDYHLARQGGFHSDLVKVLGKPRRKEDAVESIHMDIAASAQLVLEERIVDLANALHRQTRVNTLCIAGGVGFNCVANGKLLFQTPFERIFIQPASGDAGTALGAALHLYHEASGRPRESQISHAYLGPRFSDREALEAARSSGFPYEVLSEEALCEKVSGVLAAGRLVFWFQGRMEWGPRALGNRSLLADPRRAQMKDLINVKVKRREEFRPFAPSILARESAAYFESGHPSPFMLFAFKVRPGKAALIPATTHVDGTARPQTVDPEENGLYWKLIHSFGEKTGVPVLLNTSFNVQEPIVCTPGQAVDCFLRTQVDYLVLNNILVHRPSQGNNDPNGDQGHGRVHAV